MSLERISEFITKLGSTNSINQKVDIIRTFPDLKKFLMILLDSNETTGVTRKQVEAFRYKLGQESSHTDILSLLDSLYSRDLSGHAAKQAIWDFINSNESQFRETILRVVDKNLKVRITSKHVNKAFPGSIPEFSVALGVDFQRGHQHFEKHTGWYISRKYDGVRCILRISHNGDVKCFSRTGKVLKSTQHLQDTVSKLFPRGVVLDGEVCYVDEHGVEDFNKTVSMVRTHDSFDTYVFKIFDYLTLDEFDGGISRRSFMQRHRSLRDVYDGSTSEIQIVEQTPYDPSVMETMLQSVHNSGWEGLILRRDTYYKGKRSNDILKHKSFKTDDYRVLGTNNDMMRIIDDRSGLEVEEMLLKNVSIDHRGQIVHVGSGFTLEQRRLYCKYPEKIIGSLVEVQYFSEQTSLRFPVIKQVYGNQREL